MAGVSPDDAAKQAGAKPRYALGTPYGLAVDSKGLLYVADTKVGAVFIFNPESKDTGFIKHGSTPSSGAFSVWSSTMGTGFSFPTVSSITCWCSVLSINCKASSAKA